MVSVTFSIFRDPSDAREIDERALFGELSRGSINKPNRDVRVSSLAKLSRQRFASVRNGRPSRA